MTTTMALIGGLGWPELLVIALVVLLVFGPRRLPEIAESFGASIKKFRRATQDVKDEVKREIDATDTATKPDPIETPNDGEKKEG